MNEWRQIMTKCQRFICLLFCSFLVILIFESSSATDLPEKGGRVVFYYGGGSPAHFNSAIQSGTSTAMVGTQIFAGLIRYGGDWTPKPYLAKKWIWSEDKKNLVLDLVKTAKFHDGTILTAEDVVFSIETVKQYHPFKPMFKPVKKAIAINKHQVKIILDQPHPALLLCMSPALLPIIPKHVYGDGKDIKTHPANLKPIGSGPFKLNKFIRGKSIHLIRNDNFFLAEKPYLDKIVIRLVRDPKAQMIAMEREEGHILAPMIDYITIDHLNKMSHLKATTKGYDAIGPIIWLSFNLRKEPFNNVLVRKAIAHAMDIDFIIKSLHQDRAKRACGPIAPDTPFYNNELVPYKTDLEKANTLLDKAGYPIKSNGIRFSMTLDYIPVLPSQHKDLAHYLKQQLLRVGIDVRLRDSKTFVTWMNHIRNWNFDVTLDSVYNWGDPLIGVHRTYHSTNIRKGVIWSNTHGYENNKIDDILDRAGRASKKWERKELYDEFQQIVHSELPVIWINVLPFNTIYDTNLVNPPTSIWGIHSPLDELYWRKQPTKKYSEIIGMEYLPKNKKPETIGKTLAQLLGNYELDIVLKYIKNPEHGFIAIDNSGPHTFGFTNDGRIFFDSSDLMPPGFDISQIYDEKGENLLEQLINASPPGGNGNIEIRGVWPHPETQKMNPATLWCTKVNNKDSICIINWDLTQ